MGIQGTIISAKVVIESLITLLENENVDISSIKFKISNTENGSESDSLSFQSLVDITLRELDEVKAQKVAVPEGFVLVEKAKLLQILGSAVAIGTKPKTKINLLESDFIIREVKAMIEAQEPAND